jgi:hypothetical protein
LVRCGKHRFGHVRNLVRCGKHRFGHVPNLVRCRKHRFGRVPNLVRCGKHRFGHVPNMVRYGKHRFGHVPNLVRSFKNDLDTSGPKCAQLSFVDKPKILCTHREFLGSESFLRAKDFKFSVFDGIRLQYLSKKTGSVILRLHRRYPKMKTTYGACISGNTDRHFSYPAICSSRASCPSRP